MPLQVLTPASVTDLLEVAKLKERFGIPEDDTSEDVLLGEYISEVCSVLREAEVFGRELARQSYRETFRPKGRPCELKLSCNPVDPVSLTVTVDGVAADVADYELDPQSGIVSRAHGGWSGRVSTTYTGGFLVPSDDVRRGVVGDWSAATPYPLGAWARAVNPPQALRFECTGAGTSAATEPAWPDAAGETIADGTVTWTARVAEELPPVIQQLAAVAVRDLRSSVDRPAGLISSQGEENMETYSVTGSTSTGISAEVLQRFGPLRARYGRC